METKGWFQFEIITNAALPALFEYLDVCYVFTSISIVILPVRGPYLYVRILTYKDGPRTEKTKIINHGMS